MKKSKLLYAGIFLFAGFVLASCSMSVDIVKRQYSSGYYVHVSKKNPVSLASEPDAEKKFSMVQEVEGSNGQVKISEAVAMHESVNSNTSDDGVLAGKNEASVSYSGEVQNDFPVMAKDKFQAKKAVKRVRDISQSGQASDVPGILLVILCIIIPPVAILLVDGVGSPFWIDLIFWFLGAGGLAVSGLAGILWLIAVIYAFTVCF